MLVKQVRNKYKIVYTVEQPATNKKADLDVKILFARRFKAHNGVKWEKYHFLYLG